MALKTVRVLNFRNYGEIDAGPFGPVNVLIGKNGSGKTNFLEAVYYLSEQESFRGVAPSDLVQWKQESFYVSGAFDGNMVETGFSADKKFIKLNGRAAPRKDVRKNHPVIVFLPEDIRFVTGNPDEKREFIDQCLSLLDEEYREHFLRYQRTLKQRNAHLKVSAAGAPVWDRELVHHGSRIIEKRLRFIQSANVRVGGIYDELYGMKPEIKYFNTFRIEQSVEQSFRRALTESGKTERQKKYTVVGPHRDNYEVQIPDAGKRGAKSFASQGQRRCMAVALKLFVAESMMKKMKNPPVLLVDDILLELDAERRAGIFRKYLEFPQLFFTATDMALFQGIAEKGSVFSVRDGKITGASAQG